MLKSILSVAVALVLATSAPISAAQAPDVVAAARAEGTVVWYSSLDAGTLNHVVDLFNATHTGIVLKALQIGSNAIPPRVILEENAHAVQADLVSCDQFAFSQLAETEAFQRFTVTNRAYLHGMVDPKGTWAAFYSDTIALAWNPQRLKADGLTPPKSLADLARPEWKGKIGIDTTAYNWYQGILATHKDGADLVKRIAANQGMLTSGHSATITQLADGEFDVTPTAYGYMAERAHLAGRPVEFINPAPVAIGLELVGVLKGAQHPNAARVVADWLLSRPAQQLFADDGRTPVRTDVKSDTRVFDASHPFYVLPAPEKNEYNSLVAGFKGIIGSPT